jgi:hypothetical protein
MLPESGQCIEDGALSGVRITGKSDDEIELRHVDAEFGEVPQIVDGAILTLCM